MRQVIRALAQRVDRNLLLSTPISIPPPRKKLPPGGKVSQYQEYILHSLLLLGGAQSQTTTTSPLWVADEGDYGTGLTASPALVSLSCRRVAYVVFNVVLQSWSCVVVVVVYRAPYLVMSMQQCSDL